MKVCSGERHPPIHKTCVQPPVQANGHPATQLRQSRTEEDMSNNSSCCKIILCAHASIDSPGPVLTPRLFGVIERRGALPLPDPFAPNEGLVEITHLRIRALERVVKCGGRDTGGSVGLGDLERHRARRAPRRNGLGGAGREVSCLDGFTPTLNAM